MEVDAKQVAAILKTLPIGYYLGTRAPVVLDETSPTSYVNLMTREIHISLQNVKDGMRGMPEGSEIESTIRALLYHETGHLLMTPPNLKMMRWTNIMEDERLETLLRNRFHGVDFRGNVKRCTGYDPATWTPNDVCDFLFGICRFRRGPKELIDEFVDLIRRYPGNAAQEAYPLYCAYRDFFDKVFDAWKKRGEEQAEENKAAPSESDAPNGEQAPERESETEKIQNEENETEEIETEKTVTPSESEATEETIEGAKEQIRQALASKKDEQTDREVERLVMKAIRKRAASTGARLGYTGRIDPRAVAKRQDYRWLARSGGDSGKQFGRIHLRLWVDRSGSFSGDVNKVNKLLSSLLQAERKLKDALTVSVITMGDSVDIHDKTMEITANEGNTFAKESIECAKRTDKPGWRTVNVVVWDGYNGYYPVTDRERAKITREYRKARSAINQAYAEGKISDLQRAEKLYGLKSEAEKRICTADPADDPYHPMNTKDTIIVSDPSNQDTIDKSCPLARRVYIQERYAETFVGVVLKELDRVL